jgi:hypothetical protein
MATIPQVSGQMVTKEDLPGSVRLLARGGWSVPQIMIQ